MQDDVAIDDSACVGCRLRVDGAAVIQQQAGQLMKFSLTVMLLPKKLIPS